MVFKAVLLTTPGPMKVNDAVSTMAIGEVAKQVSGD